LSSQAKKILLITDVPPNAKYSGGLLTLRLAEGLGSSKVYGFYVVADALNGVKSELPDHIEIGAKYFRKPPERSLRGLHLGWHRLSFIGAAAREFYRKFWQCQRLKRQVEKVTKEQSIDKIWIILQGQTMIWLAEALIKSGKTPVHVQYWDPPAWWIRANSIDRISAFFIWKSFRFCLSNGERTATPSFSASNVDWLNSKKKTYPLIGMMSADWNESPAALSPDKPIRIGIAGQLYAVDAILAFIASLQSLDWKIFGRPVELHYWGSSYEARIEPHIIHHNHVTQLELNAQLQECEILYCPYWFDPVFRKECETSFPSKLVSYIVAGRLVFFHGPNYSGPAQMLLDHDAGVVCESPLVESIKYYLRSIYLDPDGTARKIKNASRLYKQLLSREVIAENFREFLDV